MPTNRELYQCAKLLIDKHGDDGAVGLDVGHHLSCLFH